MGGKKETDCAKGSGWGKETTMHHRELFTEVGKRGMGNNHGTLRNHNASQPT